MRPRVWPWLLDPTNAVVALHVGRAVRVALPSHRARYSRKHVQHQRLSVLRAMDLPNRSAALRLDATLTYLDEKMAGTVHLALGRSYPESGGVNSSSLHWDLICDLRAGGRLTADGEPVVEGGRLVL